MRHRQQAHETRLSDDIECLGVYKCRERDGEDEDEKDEEKDEEDEEKEEKEEEKGSNG